MTGANGTTAVMIDPVTFTFIATISMLTGTMLLMWIGRRELLKVELETVYH